MGDHGGDVDNRALASLGHLRCQGGDEEERRLDVDVVDGVEVVLAGVGGRSERVDARVVDEDVDVATPELGGTTGEFARAGLVGESGGDEVGLAAVLPDGGDDLLGPGGVAARHDHMSAVRGEIECDGTPDTAVAAGHEGGRAGKLCSHLLSPSMMVRTGIDGLNHRTTASYAALPSAPQLGGHQWY